MNWQIWAIIGFLLFCAELFVPSGFFLVLIGLSALVTSAFVWIGATDPQWLPWAIFCGCGLIMLVLGKVVFADRLSRKSKPDSRDELTGAEVTIVSTIAVGATGSGEFRGTNWQIRNETGSPLHPGQRVRVSRVEGLTLIINT